MNQYVNVPMYNYFNISICQFINKSVYQYIRKLYRIYCLNKSFFDIVLIKLFLKLTNNRITFTQIVIPVFLFVFQS